MSYEHFIDNDIGCVFVRHYGEVTVDEFTRQIAHLIAEPKFVKGMYLLRDISETTLPAAYNLELINRDLKTRIEPHDVALGSNRKAAWVLGNPKDFKVIHQFCAITRLNLKIVDRQAFRSLENAKKWLGLPEDYEIKYAEL